MRDSHSPFGSTLSTETALGPRDAIAQSVEARESSRISRLHRTLQALLDTTRANPPASVVAYDQLLGAILDAVMIASEAHMGNLQLVDSVEDALRIRVHRGFGPDFLRFFGLVPHGAYACGLAFAKGEPFVVESIQSNPLYSGESLRQISAADIQACQSLPLIHEGWALGVISVHYRSTHIPLRNRETFASTARLIAEIVAVGLPRELR